MKHAIFDFSKIRNMDDFYSEFAQQFELPDYFGYNLDALWDVITSGTIELPAIVEFINLAESNQFNSLIELFRQAEQEMHGEFYIFIH